MTLPLVTPSAAAESRQGFVRPSGSLYGLYKSWSKARQKPVTRSAAITVTPTAADDITDKDILNNAANDANDPLEPVNRVIFGFNSILDTVILTPVSATYNTVVPGPVRTGVSNAIANAKAPVTLINDLLQGEPKRAQKTFVRFLINSTAGFGGFVDAAEAGGLPRHTEDFGQTLAVWGIGAGPYLVAPVFGPTTPRHLVGRIADSAATPTTWLMADLPMLERFTPTMADLMTGHAALLDDMNNLKKTSPDYYAAVRDIYRQSRANAISNGKVDSADLPDIPDDIPVE